ncbi:MAG: hypothetical protein ACRDZ4_21365 [Egibacteraceae bacterium]
MDPSTIVQGFIVGGLLSTAGVLWRAVIKLAELGVEVKSHDRRIERLEDK